jgi:hypothetical protein
MLRGEQTAGLCVPATLLDHKNNIPMSTPHPQRKPNNPLRPRRADPLYPAHPGRPWSWEGFCFLASRNIRPRCNPPLHLCCLRGAERPQTRFGRAVPGQYFVRILSWIRKQHNVQGFCCPAPSRNDN